MSNNKKLPAYEYNKVPMTEVIKEKQEIPTKYGYGVRHIQLIICELCILVNFIARGHMGVTVVAMTSVVNENETVGDKNVTILENVENNTNIASVAENNTTIYVNDIAAGNISVALVNTTEKYYKTFNWTKSTQEMVLGSFFLGYCIMTFPMGLVVQKWGGKIPMQIALFINGVVSILTPWLINWAGWQAVCACRIMQGLSQAGLYPSIQNLLANWAPVSERGALTSYVYTGSTVGTVIAFQVSGFLSATIWGWPSAFWAVGVICLVTFALLTIFGVASPTAHKTISEEEKTYILGRVDDGNVKRRATPWKSIITSKPMWGIVATHVGSGIGFVFFFTQVPSYIHYILGINVRSSGLLSSLPYLGSFFTGISFGVLSDYLTNNKILKVKNSRRMFNCISQFGLALSLLCASFTTSTVIAVSCLVFGMGCHMAVHVGWMVNHIDLAPNFSGTLMMIGNTFMNTCNVLLPVLVSHVVTDVSNQIQWRTMFFIVAAVCLVTNAVYVILMSTETQPWNDLDDDDLEEKEPKGEKTEKEDKEKNI